MEIFVIKYIFIIFDLFFKNNFFLHDNHDTLKSSMVYNEKSIVITVILSSISIEALNILNFLM